MPAGVPDLAGVVNYPSIQSLLKSLGYSNMLKLLILMVKDFCGSFNIKYNMNGEQMLEAAAMLLDECDNFRLEDYHIMFTLGKRGRLVDVMHELDISVISKMVDEYYRLRRQAGEKVYEQQELATRNLAASKNLLLPAPDGNSEKTEADLESEKRFSEVTRMLTDWKRNDDHARMQQMRQHQEQWAQQFSNHSGIDVNEILAQFGKNKKSARLNDTEKSILGVYRILRSNQKLLNEVLKKCEITIDDFVNLGNLNFHDKNKIDVFIKTGNKLISENYRK